MSLTNRIARLNADGSHDSFFQPGNGLDGTGLAVAVLADNRLLVGGEFTHVDGKARARLAVLEADGTPADQVLDADAPVRLLLRQADAKVIVGGDFTSLGGSMRYRLARLLSGGVLEPAFEPMLSGQVQAGALQGDGKIVIGGDFDAIGDVWRDRLVRFYNGLAPNSLMVQNATEVRWTRGGGSAETERVTFEHRPFVSGAWGAWAVLTGTVARSLDGTGWQITSITPALSGRGELRARAYPAEGRNSGLVEVRREFDFKPEISVLLENQTSQALVEVTSGNAANPVIFPDTQSGAVKEMTFTIQNTGLLPLLLTDQESTSAVVYASLLGANSSQWQIATQPAIGTLQPGESTTFDLRFKPTAAGDMVAQVKILTNDADEGSFVIHVKGHALAGAGSRDEGWQPSVSYHSTTAQYPYVTALAVRNGGLAIGGAFEAFRTSLRNRLVQLDEGGLLQVQNGSAVTGANEPEVTCVAALPGGRLLVGGNFVKFNGSGQRCLVCLNADGSLYQPGLVFKVSYATSVWVRALAVQGDGAVLVGGEFTFKVSGITFTHLVRFTKDGALDYTFRPNPNAAVHSLAVQEDGKVLVGGRFESIAAVACYALARLTAGGSFDSTFNARLTRNAVVQALAVHAFTLEAESEEEPPRLVTRLLVQELQSGVRHFRLEDGAPEAGGFTLPGRHSSLALQADGKFIVAGVQSLVRYEGMGTVDGTFNTGVGGSSGAVGGVMSTAVQMDGKVLAGGRFNIGSKTYNLVRLANDNEAPTSSLTVPDYSHVKWMRGGTAPEASVVTFELSENGTDWALQKVGGIYSRRIPGGWQLTGLQLPARGSIRARARLPSGKGNGSNGMVETVTTFTNAGVPDLEVDGPNGSSVALGSIIEVPNIEAGREGTLVLRLRNTGTALEGQPDSGQISGLTFRTTGIISLVASDSSLIAPQGMQNITLRYRLAAGHSSGSLVIGSNLPGAKKAYAIEFRGFGISEPVIDFKSLKHSAVTHNTARLQVKVTPNDAQATGWFEYQVAGSSTVHRVPEGGFALANTSPVTVTYDLGGLTPQTQYVYRFSVSNSLYTRRTLADLTFKTAVTPAFP